jgi:hypothetical protein
MAKPSSLVQKYCKTQKERLEVLESLVDYFLGKDEVMWAIHCKENKNGS